MATLRRGGRLLVGALVLGQLAWLEAAGAARALTATPSGPGAPARSESPPPPATAPEPGPRAMPGASPGRLVVCESDGGYRRCPADTAGGVTLARELSVGRCRERSTWGFDSRAIWVDKGCRAEFRVAGAAQEAPSPRAEPAPAPEERSGGGGIDTGTALLILGAVVAGGAAAALLSGDEKDKASKREGIRACERALDRLVRDRGGRGARFTEIDQARMRDRVLEIEARARAEWRRGTRRGTVACRVDLRGRPEVRRLRQEGLW
ncbi:MAG: DUF3011 domain-containing protein [Geminicoccaceae bacterium]|nr:DUF3011 domain-containing protein [Geminicoccaceae bacterium]